MGKMFMAFAFVWLIVSIAGAVMAGSIAMATTLLTTAITDTDSSIPVRSTAGFSTSGIIQIGNEKIAYSGKTATSFQGSLIHPLIRGTGGTEAVAHPVSSLSGGVARSTAVRTVESSMMNQAAAYDIAAISDSSGLWAAITVPVAFFQLIGAYLTLPIGFLGTDLQILSYFWFVCIGGMLLTLGLSMAGSRRT